MKLVIRCFIVFIFLFNNTIVNSMGQSRIMAKQYAQEAAERIMKSISPNTGENPSAYISDIEWDSYASRYIIEMEASWRAGQCWLCDEEDFIVRGILKVNKNGSKPSFKETYKNAAVRGAWSDKEVSAIFEVGAALADAASNEANHNNNASYATIINGLSKTITVHTSCDGYSYESESISGNDSEGWRCGSSSPIYVKIKTYSSSGVFKDDFVKLCYPNNRYKIRYSSYSNKYIIEKI